MKIKPGFFILLIFLILGCKLKTHDTNKPILMVSILPQKYFAKKIVGDKFEIKVMIPPGASPVTYDPTPKQIIALDNAKIYFKIGYIGFELNWINNLSVDYPNINFINTAEGIKFIEDEEQHGDHSHFRLEPHVWMSPENVKIISENMLRYIKEADPQNADFYQNNFNTFIKEIELIQKQIDLKLTNITSRDFIIYHPALTYYSREFSLNQYSLEIDGKEPSVKQMTELINLAQAKNIKVIFVQSQFNQEEAKTLENEIDAKVFSIDPLDYNWNEQILEITSILSEHLK